MPDLRLLLQCRGRLGSLVASMRPLLLDRGAVKPLCVRYNGANLDVSIVTCEGALVRIISAIPLASSSDSNTTMECPLSPMGSSQKPETNPGACETLGTTCSRSSRSALSLS